MVLLPVYSRGETEMRYPVSDTLRVKIAITLFREGFDKNVALAGLLAFPCRVQAFPPRRAVALEVFPASSVVERG